METPGERLARGVHTDFAELYDACADRVHHYLVVRLGSRADADDVLQETFLRLVRTRAKLGEVENLVAYVFKIFDLKESADETNQKILIWMGILTGGAIAILLILNAWYVWSTGTRLERQLAALRDADEPVQLANLAQKPIPPDKNAAVFLRRAANDLDSMQKELMAWYPKRGYRWAFRSERAYVLSSMRELPGYDFWLMRGSANDGTLRLFELMDQYLTNASQPYAEVMAEKDATGPTPKSGWTVYRTVIEMLKPALNAAREPTERTRAMARSLRVLNALRANPLDGERVPKLSDLELAEEITKDPFNGQPLKIKRLSDGWTVYSVGRNLVDDGGNLDGATDIGIGPIRPKSNSEN